MISVVFRADGSRETIDNRTLDEARAGNLARIEREFADRVAAGITFSGRPLEIDDASQAHMNAAASLQLAGVFPASFEWRMADNSFLPVTGPQMVTLAQTAAARVYALRRARWAARDAIRAAPTRAAADAVQATWP